MRALLSSILLIFALAGCVQQMGERDLQDAIAYCKAHDGYADFRHAGKYDSSPVIGMTCRTASGSRYFDAYNPVNKAETCFTEKGWRKPDVDGICREEPSTVGNNQLDIPETSK